MTGVKNHEPESTREGHSLLRSAMDAGRLGVWQWDIRENRVTWTERIYEFHGLKPEEFDGTVEGFTRLVYPDDLAFVQQAIQKTLTGDAPYELEFRTVRPGGEIRWLATRAEVFRDKSGAPLRMIGTTHDVTARKQAEQALASRIRQEDALFRLADQLHRSVSLEDIYTAAFDAISGALQCDRVSILLYDSSNVMRFVSWRGLSDCYRQATEGHSPWKPDEKQPIPICVDDIEAADFGDELREVIKAEGIRSLAFIPLVAKGALIGKFMMYFNRPHQFSHEDVELGLAIARQLAFGIDRLRAEEALRQSEERFRKLAETLDAEVRARTDQLEQRNSDVLRQSEQLRRLSRRLLQIQDEERRRIARELHDSAGQTLTALGLNLASVAQQASTAAPRLREELAQALQFVQQLSREVRTMSYLLHPPLLEESGLQPSLDWYVRGLEERSNLRISLAVPRNFGRLPREMELAIFRLVQESLTNIHRHSGSKTAGISIERKAGRVVLEIQDHGKGISPERLSQIQSYASGVGIGGMRERVRQFDGDMNIKSNAHGTRILFTFPIPSETAKTDNTKMHSLEAAK